MPGTHGDKPMLTGNQKKIDMNKDGKITKEDFSMLRAKMAMPKKDSPSNFPAMAEEMAMAMDYNSSMPKMDHAKMYKPTKYHDMPKMAHGDKPMMGHKPKFYGKKKKK